MRVLLRSVVFFLMLLTSVSFVMPTIAFAQGQILGIHVLSPNDLPAAGDLLSTQDNANHFVTIPFTLDDIGRKDEWQSFFDQAAARHLTPILRLATRFDGKNWVVPNRSDVMNMASFLTSLDWHEDSLIVILFNEPNHAPEWGGSVDPVSYANMLDFSVQWFKTEPKHYTVLPAALDLAATTGGSTVEAFTFLRQVLAYDKEWLDQIDGWSSHSYPNPGFSASPYKDDKESLRGYTYELSFLSGYTTRQLHVYITETGWNQNTLSNWQIRAYYAQAYQTIWSKDPRIVAVTPFLLQGAPGTFAPFSFLDARGNPTIAYEIYKSLLDGKE
ncbi:hypothetical protein C5B42_06140 [Candidatus Cerribacteria bacterium 'Amazon FNV 2010 28 9']|uniref:Asl1-like glycosyl hydrolase catalytic domain-containing protein n=1 Tax=Candidatus Cerribacteria bacterium 'Amazon FNV 2010 28 9' TaxID=2081795 RepID=A0A317JRN2_9BACT|nr:MAG: hypothetical protein C5B42_06140 [Candidatus Cerribacteria bacterium 'Amazon FNV 2010 28 9']